MSWLCRGARWIGWRDVAHVLSPLAPLVTTVDYIVRHDRARLEDDLDARDPELIAWVSEAALALGRLFRLDVHGIGNVPASGGALLVGNHNGGLIPLDSVFTVATVCDHFGPERVLNPLAHDLVLYDRAAHRFAGPAGILRAGHDGAARALGRGNLVLVYPGSDIETFRPWGERHRIELAGRTGFIALALREQVPVIPVVAAGTHEQWIVLTRGDRVAKALRTGRYLRTKVLPWALALPFGLTFGLFPYLPLPAQTSLAFGRPISWPGLGPAAADDPVQVQRCYDEVVAAMQAILDALAAERVPFIGQSPARRAAVDRLVSVHP